jgi:hypothetical protein
MGDGTAYGQGTTGPQSSSRGFSAHNPQSMRISSPQILFQQCAGQSAHLLSASLSKTFSQLKFPSDFLRFGATNGSMPAPLISMRPRKLVALASRHPYGFQNAGFDFTLARAYRTSSEYHTNAILEQQFPTHPHSPHQLTPIRPPFEFLLHEE